MSILGLLGDGDDGRGGVPATAFEVNGSDRARLVHDALLRLGLATDWRARDVDALTMRDYRNAVGHAIGVDVRGGGFTSTDLSDLCVALGIETDPGDTTREMRREIAGRVGFDYESPQGRIREFRRGELQQVAMRVIKAEHGGDG